MIKIDIKKKISICMMIKNEEKNLQRCLNSLKPILDSGLGELIIVDTGSSDNSISIAKEYTENVYEHPWNNDFAAMRNITISYSKGEWIWMMDADEELENPEEMLKLFSSDLGKYNTMTIKMKNYKKVDQNSKESSFNISVLKRGFRNSKNFKFEGSIHEQPTAKPPFLASDIILGHYGYMWEDKELTQRKYDRTTKMLEVELKKNPKSIYNQFQLATAYSIKDYDKGLKEFRKAYQLIQELPSKDRIKYLYVYGVYAKIANACKKFTEAIKVCKEGLSYTKDYIDLWYFWGVSCIAMGEDEDALTIIKEFFECEKRFDKTAISKDSSFTFYCLDNDTYAIALYLAAMICIEKDENIKALDYIKVMEPSKLKSKVVSDIAMKEKMQQVLFDYLDEIEDREDIKQEFLNIIDIRKDDEQGENQYINNIIDYYHMNHKEDDSYLWLSIIRKGISENRLVEKNVIEKIVKVDFDKLDNYYGDIITYVIKQKIKFSILESVDPQIINRFMKYVMEKYENIDEDIKFYLDIYENTDNTNKLRNWIVLARYPLLKGKLDDYKYKELFIKYVDKGIKYVNYIYNENVLNEEIINNIENSEHRFFLYMSRAYEVKQKDAKTYIEFLRKALKSYPMKKGIEILFNEAKQENYISESNTNMLSEFESYKKIVRKNIDILIKSRQIGEAKAIINEYLAIVPDDSEMLALKSEVQQLVM